MRLTLSKSALRRIITFHDRSLLTILSLRALFKLTAFTEDERELHVFTGDSVHDCIASADTLIANRGGIWDALELLETSTELTVCEPTFTLECD